MPNPDDIFYRVVVEAPGAEYDLSLDLSSVVVDERSGDPTLLTLKVSDPFKVLGHALQEGMEVEVDLGTRNEHAVVFRGRIYKSEAELPAGATPFVRLLAYDASMAMGLRRRNRTHVDVSLSSLVTQIAAQYFDAASITTHVKGDPTFEGNGIRQQEETDLALLRRLAAAYGCQMYVVPNDRTQELLFEAQYYLMTREPRLTLHHGRVGATHDLVSFEASSDVSHMRLPERIAGMMESTGESTEVTTRAVEPAGDLDDLHADEHLAAFAKEEPLRAERLASLLVAAPAARQKLIDELGTAERRAMPVFTTEEELAVLAENQFSTCMHGMRGNGRTDGTQSMHANSVVRIDDVGGRFSGTWYLSQVRHILDGQGYRTEFECQR